MGKLRGKKDVSFLYCAVSPFAVVSTCPKCIQLPTFQSVSEFVVALGSSICYHMSIPTPTACATTLAWYENISCNLPSVANWPSWISSSRAGGVIGGVQRRVYTLFRGMGLRGLPVLQLGSNTVVGMITRENLSDQSIEEFLARKVMCLFASVCSSVSSGVR